MSRRPTHSVPCELTQLEIARRMGVAQPRISQWLSGRYVPRPDTMVKLAETLGMDVGELSGYIISNRQARSLRTTQDGR